jgi:hypothetical protein
MAHVTQQAWSPAGAEQLPALALPDVRPRAGRDFGARIWLHRVNSVTRARWAAERYPGLEIDLVYEPERGEFDVRHPPAPSIELSLGALLATLHAPQRLWYWLDLKRVPSWAAHEAAAQLDLLLRRLGLHDRCVVESTVAPVLAAFSARGFYTSYGVRVKGLYGAGDAAIRRFVEATTLALRESGANAISAPHEGFELLQRYFPHYDLLFWGIQPNSLRARLREYKLLSAAHVKVVLHSKDSDGFR